MKGEGAHSELIDYICERHGLGEARRDFIQQMRIYRNRISYEGFSVKADYIERNEPRINEVITQLIGLVRKKM